MSEVKPPQKKDFLKVYYEYLEQGIPPAECLMLCTIHSWSHHEKSMVKGRLKCRLGIFKNIKISRSQKYSILEKLVENRFIKIHKKDGDFNMYIEILKKPSSKSKWWKIKTDTIADVRIDEKTKRSDYTLLLLDAYIGSLLKRFACVNYDKLVKSGLFDTKTIRAKLKLIDDLKTFRIDERLYLTSEKAYKQIPVPPANTTPDKDIYKTNDVYTVCRTLKLYGLKSIEVLRTYNALGRVLYPPVNDNDKDKAVAYG